MHLSRLIKHPYFILTAIFILHLCNNLIVVNLDKTPLVYDPLNYYYNAKIFFHILNITAFRPPLLSFVTFPLFKLFGASSKVAVAWVSNLSLLLLILAVYFLGREVYSKETGLLSAFIISIYPIIFGHSRSFMPELLLMIWVVTSILLMIKADGFSSLKFVIPLGVVMGLGMLTKITYPFFVIGPFIYFLFKKTAFSKRVLINLFIMGLIIFTLSFSWYLANIKMVIKEYIQRGHFSFSEAGINLANIWQHILWYPKVLFRDGMGLFNIPSVIYSIIILLYSKAIRKKFPWLTLFLLWMLVPYFISLTFAMKNPRYIMSILPPIAIISSLCILNLENPMHKKKLVTIVILLGSVQFFLISYFPFAKAIFPVLQSLYDNYSFCSRECSYQWFGLLQPRRQDWKIAEVCNLIKELKPHGPRKIIFIETRPIIYDGVRRELFEEDLLRFINHTEFLTTSELFSMKINEADARDSANSILNAADIVITTENSKGIDTNENDVKLKHAFERNISRFSPVTLLSLPDDSHLKVYKRAK